MKQTPEQETTAYLLSTAEQIVSSTLFPSTLNDWFNLDLKIRNSESISIFKNKLLSFHPVQTNNIFDPKGPTFRTSLRLGLSHLNEHRF